MTGLTAPPARRDRGTASIEVVGLMPVVAVVVLCCLQLFAAAYTVMAANTAARQGARAASLGQDAASAARGALPGGLDVSSVSTYGSDNGVAVRVVVPSVHLFPTFTVERRAEMP